MICSRAGRRGAWRRRDHHRPSLAPLPGTAGGPRRAAARVPPHGVQQGGRGGGSSGQQRWQRGAGSRCIAGPRAIRPSPPALPTTHAPPSTHPRPRSTTTSWRRRRRRPRRSSASRCECRAEALGGWGARGRVGGQRVRLRLAGPAGALGCPARRRAPEKRGGSCTAARSVQPCGPLGAELADAPAPSIDEPLRASLCLFTAWRPRGVETKELRCTRACGCPPIVCCRARAPPPLPRSVETKELKLRPATDVHDYQVRPGWGWHLVACVCMGEMQCTGARLPGGRVGGWVGGWVQGRCGAGHSAAPHAPHRHPHPRTHAPPSTGQGQGRAEVPGQGGTATHSHAHSRPTHQRPLHRSRSRPHKSSWARGTA